MMEQCSGLVFQTLLLSKSGTLLEPSDVSSLPITVYLDEIRRGERGSY